jgi:hypothetical protein
MTNERQIALSLMETFKEKTVPGQLPMRESTTDASGQRDWVERKFQELRQEAGVPHRERKNCLTFGFISLRFRRSKDFQTRRSYA